MGTQVILGRVPDPCLTFSLIVKNDMSPSSRFLLNQLSRRRLLQGSACWLGSQPLFFAHAAKPSSKSSDGLQSRIYKTLKVGMADVPGSLSDKFSAIKAAGFAGVELDTGNINVKETREAITATGLVVDGTVCAGHWSIRHTSPSDNERAQALEILRKGLRDTHAIGGHTVLLVVGHGQDGTEEELWTRSVDNISQAVPLAAELGIYIAIENVWNHFLYNHDGAANQTADKFIKYVDAFNSPWVGMQFDIGNHWKYGSMGDWIRALGKRIVKLDVKGFSRKKNEFTKIGDGDLDWADVRRALDEIGFVGWAAAEVAGGGPDRLREVSNNLDRVFAL